MKHYLLLYFFSFGLFAQSGPTPERPKVDERIELLSIVFRMSGAEEYSSEKFKLYADRIYDHFMPYIDHPLMKFVQHQREIAGTGYDAVMEMAIHTGPAPDFTPLFPFTDKVPARWGKARAEEFVALLEQFYKDADCETFFKQNRELYRQSEELFLPVYAKLDTKWYREFYGKEPKEKFNIILGLGNGGGSYGPDIEYPDGRREIFAIMGAWSTDTLGMVRYDDAIFPVLLHEFNHSFVNYLTGMHKGRLKKSGKAIYNAMEAQMRSQAYATWETMLNEALVRAAVIRYMKDHDYSKESIDAETKEQLNRGFIWIGELGQKLEEYSNNREKYPTLESYMPEIIAFYTELGRRFDKVKATFDAGKPKVVKISEFTNNAKAVAPVLKTITVHFDRVLEANGFSIHLGSKGKDAFPKIAAKPVYSEDKRSLTIHVDLQPDKEYQLVLAGTRFRSAEGIGMDDYEINFTTAHP